MQFYCVTASCQVRFMSVRVSFTLCGRCCNITFTTSGRSSELSAQRRHTKETNQSVPTVRRYPNKQLFSSRTSHIGNILESMLKISSVMILVFASHLQWLKLQSAYYINNRLQPKWRVVVQILKSSALTHTHRLRFMQKNTQWLASLNQTGFYAPLRSICSMYALG